MSLLDFAGKIMQEFEGMMFFGFVPFVYGCHLLGVSTILITYQKQNIYSHLVCKKTKYHSHRAIGKSTYSLTKH